MFPALLLLLLSSLRNHLLLFCFLTSPHILDSSYALVWLSVLSTIPRNWVFGVAQKNRRNSIIALKANCVLMSRVWKNNCHLRFPHCHRPEKYASWPNITTIRVWRTHSISLKCFLAMLVNWQRKLKTHSMNLPNPHQNRRTEGPAETLVWPVLCPDVYVYS